MSTANLDVASKLSNLLPTGTFLGFQALAPLFTNNGECGNTEKIMTGILLLTFVIICWVLNFTDSITTKKGTVYYGIVTSRGLFNPQFKGSNIIGVKEEDYFYDDEEKRYRVNTFDFINGVFDIIAFGALTVLTPPITTCYYPNISTTIVKTVPILVAIIVGSYCAIAPTPRQGVGFSLPVGKVDVASEKPSTENAVDSSTESLLTSSGQVPSRNNRVTTVSSPGRATV